MYARIFKIFLVFSVFACTSTHRDSRNVQGLKAYLEQEDASYSWKSVSQESNDFAKVSVIEMDSQVWREIPWKHKIILIQPKKNINPKICFLYVSGSQDGSKDLNLIEQLSRDSSVSTAIISAVPNQPVLEGKKEDALLAYSFHKFVESGDASWPVIFPMVKSVKRAMDSLSQYTELEEFIVSGASKRGWTTWLTAATDQRVKAIAPLVFDMLNMNAQVKLAEESYGAQSEKIKDYTELGLVERIEEPRTKLLVDWVDPYRYLNELSLPKLVLLGTNDPYWVVDSQKLYWADLKGPKLLYQVPNGTHSISSNSELRKTLAEWIKKIALKSRPVVLNWNIADDSKSKGKIIKLFTNQSGKEVVLWTAKSETRDFRKAIWEEILKKNIDASGEMEFNLAPPTEGYVAYMLEVRSDPSRFSSEVVVLNSQN